MMKTKKMPFIAGILAFSSVNVFAVGYGQVNLMSNWKTGMDQQNGIATGFAGIKDNLQVKDLGLSYQLEGQFAASGDRFDDAGIKNDEIELRIAAIKLTTKSYGAIYMGRGMSGTYRNLYSRTDIHPFTNVEKFSMNKILFQQGKYSNNVLAYASPKFKSSVGNFQFKLSSVNPQCEGGANDDALGARLLYSTTNFNAEINYTRKDPSLGGDDRKHHNNQWAIGADYTIGYVTLGYTGEFAQNSFYYDTSIENYLEGYDEQTHSVSILTKVDDMKYGLSFQLRNSDNVTRDDIGLLIGSVVYSYSKELDFAIEYANYTGSNDYLDYADSHSFTAGLTFRF
ncbi:hypothetical protein HR45_13215 [Shewanella mangrovi]|uniref:Porin n=1 Tax=Shewanella mangrovi TaxID=1515746 RepID=A0A094JG38_9GAMM|nr:porin [Shewanella mangrovi]KFZ36999.1 hypothetical protein HR45_13215 [Shewanella mangrovi]